MTALPPPRTPGRYTVALVCLGNICRSPMADVVLNEAVARAGLAEKVRVDSCGTGGWHVGKPMDRRAAATLTEAGYDPRSHRARQLGPDWFDRDVLLAMDESNHRDLLAASPPDPARVQLFRDYDPDAPGASVPDPYYGGDDGFGEVLTMVRRTTTTLVEALAEIVAAPGPASDESAGRG